MKRVFSLVVFFAVPFHVDEVSLFASGRGDVKPVKRGVLLAAFGTSHPQAPVACKNHEEKTRTAFPQNSRPMGVHVPYYPERTDPERTGAEIAGESPARKVFTPDAFRRFGIPDALKKARCWPSSAKTRIRPDIL